MLTGETDDGAPQPGHVLAGGGDVLADSGAHLDDRLVKLLLDLVGEPVLALGEHLLDVRLQGPGLRIDELEFLLDAQSERGTSAHGASFPDPR